MHAAKTLGWAGATPLLTAFSRPKFRGIAPARPGPLGAMFWPHAYKDAIGQQQKGRQFQNTERRATECQS